MREVKIAEEELKEEGHEVESTEVSTQIFGIHCLRPQALSRAPILHYQ